MWKTEHSQEIVVGLQFRVRILKDIVNINQKHNMRLNNVGIDSMGLEQDCLGLNHGMPAYTLCKLGQVLSTLTEKSPMVQNFSEIWLSWQKVSPASPGFTCAHAHTQ